MGEIQDFQQTYFDILCDKYRVESITVQNVFEKNNTECHMHPESLQYTVLPCDHYRIFEGELVLDFEWHPTHMGTHKMLNLAKQIKDYCINNNITCYVYHSGGTGIHIHMFTLDKTQKNILYQQLDKQFHLNIYVDLGTLDYAVITNKHMIRSPGGRKIGTRNTYKTHLTDFTKLNTATSTTQIQFPNLTGLHLWHSFDDTPEVLTI